jgi:Ulp1 family protease
LFYRFLGKDIFNLDKIFFPVNVGRTHWVVVVAFMQEKRIQFFDSFGDSGRDWMEAVFLYIKDEHIDKKKCPLPDEDKWVLVPCVRGTPRQLNGESV